MTVAPVSDALPNELLERAMVVCAMNDNELAFAADQRIRQLLKAECDAGEYFLALNDAVAANLELSAQVANLIRYARWFMDGEVSADSMGQAINVAFNTLPELRKHPFVTGEGYAPSSAIQSVGPAAAKE